MATYEELTKMLDGYNPQPQQELGVNSFNQGGMIQQEETPYQRMMRETYGAPAQQQEEPGLFGSVVNRMSGQPQQQGTEEPSFLGSAFRGAMAQGTGTIGGQADFLAGATGSETLRSIGDAAQKKMQEYSRPHEYTFNDIFGDGLSSVWKYLSDPNGAAYDIGGGLGSTAAMAAEAALLSAALPSSVAAAGTGAVAAFATRLGLKSVAGALSKGGTAAKLIKNVIASTPLEAASESGGTYREMTTDEQGNRINPEDLDMDKVQEAMAKNFVGNLGVLGASNLLESVGIGRLFGDKMRQGILGKVRDIGAFMATNAGQNAWEEGAQTGSNLYAQGKIDNISQIVNPFEWNPEQIDAATIGGIAGLGQGTFMGGAGHVLNKIAGPQQQEGNPAVNIQNQVTNNEFGDAVAVAKHDTSTNLVDRMRNLEGRIGYHASDGTNCARTIGLALAGTDYQDQINVDNFVAIARDKGQLKDPNNYVPKPGDLAVVNGGNHIVMVSENGGTIQNGSSRDGVYESAQSPLQMFGAVQYYISTSELSSGDYGVSGNLQGLNEEQRQQEYYQNLVAQERQRREDSVREVLGAKTHAQEQQEQAVSEAQKYQQDNASELGSIDEYYKAFTEQELDALSPEQRQSLKNSFDTYYSEKQNWSDTAAERVRTARGMYNQMVGQVRQQVPAANRVANQAANQAVNNVQGAAGAAVNAANNAAPVTGAVAKTETPATGTGAAPTITPTTTPTTETAVSPTEKQNPVVQQQNYKTRSEAAKDLPSRIQKAVADANGDYAKLHSALTTEATDLENDLSFGKITEDEYKTAKAQLDEAQNKYLYNKNNQTTQTDISPDEWEKRLRKATEDLGEAYRNGNITKDEYERRMQAIDDAYDKNVTQKRGFTQYGPDETGFMERQAAEQKAIDENVAKGNRVKFMGMVDDLYKKRKNGQTEEDKKLIASQTNAAFKTGLAMLDKGATAEEAFNAVKDSIGTEKQKAKAKAEAEKQAKKGEKKNAVTEQKSTELQKPEAEQGRDKDVNAKPEEGKREENKNGETAENKGKAEVRENGNNEGTVSEASGTSESGSISEDGRGRETEPVSGHEGGTGETVLRANDENVRDQKSDRGEDAASGLPEQSADVGGTANGQDAVRGELSTAEQTYNGDLEKANKAVEDGTVSVAEAKKQAEAAANEYDKQLDKAEEKAEAPTTGKGDPIIVSDSLRKAYEELKNIIVKVGKNLYRLAIVRSKANNDGVMRWETTDGKPVSSDEALRCLLYEAIKTNDNGDFVTLDEIIANLEKKKEQVGLTPNFQEALDLAKKLKKENIKLTTTNNEQAKSKSQTPATEDELASARKTYERKVENIQADLSFDLITKEKADKLMKEAQEEFKNALKKWANKSDASTEKALNRYEEERNKWKAEDRAKTRSLRITLGNKTYSPIISDVDPFGYVRITGWTDPNTGEQIKGELGRLLRWIHTSLGVGAFVDAKLTPGNVLMENTLDDVIERLEQIKKELTERSKTGRIPRMSALEYAKQLKAEGKNATIHFAEDVDNTTPDNTTKYQAAYHGASTLFDTFTLEHTDKGINLHGWGLYFAKNRENAEKYQAAKSKGTYEVYSNGKQITDKSLIDRLIGRFSEEILKVAPERVANRVKEDIADAKKETQNAKEALPKLEKALNAIENNVPEGVDLLESFDEIYDKLGSDVWDVIFKIYSNNYIKGKNDLTSAIKRAIAYQNSRIEKSENEIKTLSQVDPDTLEVRNVGEKGHLYEVDIPENDVLLDEQKKFGDQPEKVQRAIDKLYKDRDFGTRFYNLNGEGIYNDLVAKLGSKRAASELLNQYGVEGITYNDWEDGRCFVVFSDQAVKMMQRYDAAVTNKQEEIKRSLDELITEAKRAFKGAKGFRINRNDLIFTMPNGLEMKVNIKDQILLSAADEAKARKEHGLTDPNQRITVEGYARRLDKGSLVALSKESGRGTAFHETFHTVWDWVLTEKEKAAMLKHFTPIAEKLGIDVEEAMADGYRDWLLARQQHKGTLFGKLYQKVLDFVNGALRVLTGTENVHDIYRQIEEGKVWNRDEKGRFAKAENSETNQGEKKFLVTNNKITADTQVPVIDVTNVARANTTDPAVRAAIAESLIGKTFRILGSDGIGFTQKYDKEVLPNGRIKESKPNEHLVRGAGRNEFDKGLVREERQKALAIADTILDNAMYIEKHPDANHGTDTRYVDLYAAVQNGDKVYPIHIQAKEKDGSAGEFVVGKAMYYQLTRKGPLPATAKQLLASANDNGPSISVAQLLQNVKDKAGRPYVINGQLNYESAALSALPSGTKYSARYEQSNVMSSRWPTGATARENAMDQLLYADFKTLKRDKATLKAVVGEMSKIDGFSDISTKNPEKAAEEMISRIKSNLIYLHNLVPENLRKRAKKWYDGGRRMAEEWSKRYGISPQAAAGVVAVLSPQKNWFENVSLGERILDCIYGKGKHRWDDKMTKEATVKKNSKDAKGLVAQELVPELEKAKGKTLQELIDSGEYTAAAIWIRAYDKAHNEKYYRVVTPEGGTGDYQRNAPDKNGNRAKSAIRWQSYDAIAKAISIAVNPSYTNIFWQLGEMHKVRNFFNNLYAPDNDMFATIDTHAVGAGIMQAVSGKTKAVEQNFGSAKGTPSSVVTGLKGTYAIYFEAYKQAAKELHLKPRELQSITWEAVRNIFPDTMKDSKKETEQQRTIRQFWANAAKQLKNAKTDAEKQKILAETQDNIYNYVTGGKKQLSEFAWEKTSENTAVGDTYNRSDIEITRFKRDEKGKTSGFSVGFDFEFDPDNEVLKELMDGMSPEEKAAFATDYIEKAVSQVLNEFDTEGAPVPALTVRNGETKTGFIVNVQYPQQTVSVAKMLGHVLGLKSVVVVAAQEVQGTTPGKTLAVRLPQAWGEKEIAEFGKKLAEIKGRDGKPAITVHSAANGTMTIVNTSEYSAENLGEKIKTIAPGLDVASTGLYSAPIDSSEFGYKNEIGVKLQIPKGWSTTEIANAAKKIDGMANKSGEPQATVTSTTNGKISLVKKNGKLSMKSLIGSIKKMLPGLVEAPDITIKLPDGWKASKNAKDINAIINKLNGDHVSVLSTDNGYITLANMTEADTSSVVEEVKKAVPDLEVRGTEENGTGLNAENKVPTRGTVDWRANNIKRRLTEELEGKLRETRRPEVPGDADGLGSGGRASIKTENQQGNRRVLEQEENGAGIHRTGRIKTSIRRQVNFEVAPDPDNETYSKAWNEKSPEEQQEISDDMAPKYARKVLQKLGIPLDALKPQIGGFEGKTNPSFYLDVDADRAIEVGNLLGYVTRQKSMMIVSPNEIEDGEKKGQIIISLPEGWGKKEVAELYDKLYTITDNHGNPLIGGHSTRNGKMEIVNFSDMPEPKLVSKIAELVPELKIETSQVYAAFPDKSTYGFAATKEEVREGVVYDEGANLLREQFTEELEDKLGIAKGRGVSEAEGRVGRRNGPDAERTKESGVRQLPGEGQEGNESSGRLEAREAADLYEEAAEKYPQIKDKAVSENVKYAIRQTVDFGKREGDILDSASGKGADAVISDGEGNVGGALRGDSGRVRSARNSKEVGFGLTRSLINDGYANLTGRTVNNVSDLAEIAQVLRHPGYEKVHSVYVKGGEIVHHETTTTMLPNCSSLFIDNEQEWDDYFDRIKKNIESSGADTVYLLHNHPSGDITPSSDDKNITKQFADSLAGLNNGVKFGGHIVLDTTECAVMGENGQVQNHKIPEAAQIRYSDSADVPHILLGSKMNSADHLISASKKLADGSKTTVFFVDSQRKVRGVVQLPSEFAQLAPDRMNRYLRWLARKEQSAYAYITTSDESAYEAMLPLYEQGYGVSDIYLTKNFETAKERSTKPRTFDSYNFFGIESGNATKKELDNSTDQTKAGTREGASSMSKFSVRQEQQEQTEKQAELAQQKKDIRKQYEGTKQWMKAPNGEPSKLNEDQWVLVRTPQFKEWFGDWENDPENASKVVDENGEPRVVYHGTTWTPTKENGTFDKRRAGQNFDFVDVDYNFFFTASKEMAKGYGHALPLFLNIRNPEIYENEDHWMDKDEDAMFDALVTGHDFGDGVVKVNDVRAKDADGVIYRGVVYNEESAAAYDKRMEELAKARRPVEKDFAERRGEANSKLFDARDKLFKKLSEALTEEFNRRAPELKMTEERAKQHLHIMLSGRDGDMGKLVESVKLYNPGSAANSEYDVLLSRFNEAKAAQDALEKEYAESYQEYKKQLPDDPETELYNDANVYACDEPNQIKDASGNNVSITKDSDNIHYSITSAAGKALDKVEAYVNRNVRTPNENTATGRASKAFNNTQNKNRAQTWTEWLRDRFEKFYREWIDKNDAIHNVDDTIEKITGKKLAEEDKIYNMVQGARAYAQGAADTLVQGSKEAFESLKDALGRGIDPKDTAAMKRLAELKKDFKFATVKEALEPIMKKDMDQKYPDYLEKNGINNWHDAFSNYLGARRILELVRLVEDKSLQYITHDKKEFTDFIDRHPEYEKFRPQPFAKGSWRTQVQNVAKNDPALAEKMAKELAKEYKFPKGVTREDLEALVREAPKEFDSSAQIYYQLQRNLLTMMELGHLIPADIHDKVNSMYRDYCPLMIDYSDTAGLDTAIAQFGRGSDSIANVDSMLKHVLQLGSERGLISPLESTYKSIQALTNRAERNKVAVHFIKTVANSKELQSAGILKQVPGSSPDAKNCVFTALINGKKVAFQTTQDLYGPIVGYDMPAAGIVEGMCRSAAQALRYGATTSPSFIVRNFIRDTIFAGVSSRNGFVPVVDSFRGMWAYLHDKELRGEFDAMGITAYNYFGSGESAVKSMEELMGEKDWAYLKAHPTELIKELIKYVPKKFAAASEVVEASTRMGEYMKARKAGKSMQEAALDARDVTLDFSRSGFYGQRVNMMVPFFNACIQGGDKMFNRMLFSKDPKVRAQTLRMLGLYIMLPSVALWFMHKDEPWYEELDPHIKMNNWIIGKFRIPKPQEAGIAFGSGIEAILDKIYNKDPKAGKEWVNAMREVLIPNLIPTVGLPILEWVTNYSLFRDKAIEGNRLKRLPAEMRYNNSTTEVSKLVGAKTGLSPVKLDNTIRGYTGTLGMLTAQAFDWFLEENRNRPSKKATERVMVRDFFLNDMNMNRTSEEFYEMANAAQQQHAGYGKKGHPTPAVKAVNKALRDVSKQQKEIQEITNAKNIGPSTKRQLIDKKRELIKTIQRKTLQRYRDKFNV